MFNSRLHFKFMPFSDATHNMSFLTFISLFQRFLYRLFLILSQRPYLDLFGILVFGLLFKFIFTPNLSDMGPYSLISSPGNFEALEQAYTNKPLSLLLPLFFPNDGREFWWTTSIIPFYFLFKMFSPLLVYILLSSIFVTTSYICSWKLLHSRIFSGLLAFLFIMGTQLSYGLTMGLIIGYYLLLTYITLNITVLILILQTKSTNLKLYFLFIFSLILCLLGHEMCLNYVASLILCLGFISIWARHHQYNNLSYHSLRLLAITIISLIIYLSIQFISSSAGKYFKAGVEEELIFNHDNILIIMDDLIINYFTLLYLTLSNYLPSFLFFSNSITYLGETKILAAQNGYHPSHTHLAYMSYLFQWRFYAGVVSTLFFIMGFKWIRDAWQNKTNIHTLLLSALFIAVITGFSTHFIIKVRPYNTTPMLTYKVMFSVFAFTILIAYVLTHFHNHLKTFRQRNIFISFVIIFILASSFTRPGAMNAGLSAVGLAGYGNPIITLTRFFRDIRSFFTP